MLPLTQRTIPDGALSRLLLWGPPIPQSQMGSWRLLRAWWHDHAYTGLDITNYMMLVENDAFPEALGRFSSFFTDPLLDPTTSTRRRTRSMQSGPCAVKRISALPIGSRAASG